MTPPMAVNVVISLSSVRTSSSIPSIDHEGSRAGGGARREEERSETGVLAEGDAWLFPAGVVAVLADWGSSVRVARHVFYVKTQSVL